MNVCAYTQTAGTAVILASLPPQSNNNNSNTLPVQSKQEYHFFVSVGFSFLSLFPGYTHKLIQYTHHIYQSFYNIVCLTTRKHTVRRAAQSKHSTHKLKTLSLLKRIRTGPIPGSHNALLETSALPGVCQRCTNTYTTSPASRGATLWTWVAVMKLRVTSSDPVVIISKCL